jgi:hypothetical protein
VNGTSGSTSLVPLILTEADPMNRLDLTLAFDPKICTAEGVVLGDFTKNVTLTPALDRSEVRIALASPDGFGGSGVLAWVRLRVLASSGSSKIQVLSARSSVPLQKIDGRLAIIPGIAFSRMADGRQRVTVARQASAALVSGDTISFSDGGMQILIHTDGIGATDTIASGLVHNVTMTSPPATVTLDSGTVEGSFTLTLPEYPSEGSLSLALSPTPSLAFNEAVGRTVTASRLNLTAVTFSATPSVHGIGTTGPVRFSFRLPPPLTPGVNETFRLAQQEGEGAVTLTTPTLVSDDGTLRIAAVLSRVPDELALLTVKEVPRQGPVTVTYTKGSILSGGAESAGGGIWGAMIMMFFLIAIVVIGIFYVYRKRGG